MDKHSRFIATFLIAATVIINLKLDFMETAQARHRPEAAGLWAHDNLFAWGVLPGDSMPRSPEERAQMLERLGIRKIAFDWQAKDVAAFDEQIEAFKRHGIQILAWSIYDVDASTIAVDWKTHKIQDLDVLAGRREPAADAMSVGEMLEMFKRHNISPQLWVMRRMRYLHPPATPPKPMSQRTVEEKNEHFRQLLGYDLTQTPQEQALRVRQEADHIKPLAQLAESYGVKVALYKHGGWIGMTENQIAVTERLQALGMTNTGVVYNFIHAHDEADDTEHFPALWKRVQPYVFAVNVTGVHADSKTVFPILYVGEGAVEMKLMRTIQNSGWIGPIGLSPEKGGDAEVNLRNSLIGIDWIAAELGRPGSGGPPPFQSSGAVKTENF